MNVYLKLFLIQYFGIQAIECSITKHSRNIGPKKLFISKQVVTDYGIIDGGVLVNNNGVIEAVLSKDNIAHLININSLEIEIIDGENLVLMPGVIDTHVHVNEPGRTSWEGYVTATKAAAWGGITTIIDMPLNSIPPTISLENLKIKASIAREEVYVDVGFWGGVVPGNEFELGKMIKAGVVGFKCFLSDSGVSEFPMVGLNDLEKAFYFLNNTGSVLAFHAELSLENIISYCNYTSSDLDPSCPDPALYSTYLASNPPQSEIEAAKIIASFLPFYK